MKILALLGMLTGCGLAVVAPSLTFAEYPSPEKQMKLDDGMTMEQVEALLGKPDEVSQTTCGAQTARPWTCRVWKYGDVRSLRVYFSRDRQRWVVNHWG